MATKRCLWKRDLQESHKLCEHNSKRIFGMLKIFFRSKNSLWLYKLVHQPKQGQILFYLLLVFDTSLSNEANGHSFYEKVSQEPAMFTCSWAFFPYLARHQKLSHCVYTDCYSPKIYFTKVHVNRASKIAIKNGDSSEFCWLRRGGIWCRWVNWWSRVDSCELRLRGGCCSGGYGRPLLQFKSALLIWFESCLFNALSKA